MDRREEREKKTVERKLSNVVPWCFSDRNRRHPMGNARFATRPRRLAAGHRAELHFNFILYLSSHAVAPRGKPHRRGASNRDSIYIYTWTHVYFCLNDRWISRLEKFSKLEIHARSRYVISFALTSKVMNFSFSMVTRLLGRFAQWSANNENIYLFLDSCSRKL